MGYISFSKADYEDAKMFFSKAYKAAKSLKEPEIAEQCMCNVGKSFGEKSELGIRDFSALTKNLIS